LAVAVAGTYHGDIISDARGSSRSDVMITVARVGPGVVSVTCACTRIPARTVRLTQVMQTIQNAGGASGEVFLYDQTKSPPSLMLTIDDAAWSGVRH
jgi:hypothetical protein